MNKQHHTRIFACLAVVGLVVASCSSGSDDTTGTEGPGASEVTADDTSAPDDSAAPVDTGADDTTAPDDTGSGDTAAPDDTGSGDDNGAPASDGFADRGPATGEPIVIGMVNTEGVPGLDFPEMRTDTDLAVEYLNEHGGMGGRPVQVEHCAAAGSPESSQGCAQELAGKGVELVMLGLDLFPGYDTFAASDIPVTGALPILPPDYTANALFITGGNATTMSAMVLLAVEHFEASSVGIISADNVGANGSEASLIASLEKAGLTYVSVKGGDNETDAGFQGLLREANADNPDLLISLYSDAGCIGSMRGRVALGITTPTITTPICAGADVIDVVGDDALGWFFVAVGEPEDTPTAAEFETIVEAGYGPDATGSLGLGALGITQVMTLARVANAIADEGGEVTGASIYETLGSTTTIRDFPNDTPLSCGLNEQFPTICSFVFPAGEYVAGGDLKTVPGFEAFNVVDYMA